MRAPAATALVLLAAVAGSIAQAPVAGADNLAPVGSSSPGQTEYWCGHYDHSEAGSGPLRPTCPKPTTPQVSLVTDAPNGPFSSGQYIDVKVGPNRMLKPGRHVSIEECAAPGGAIPKSANQCDRRTIQTDRVVDGSDGSVSYQGYPIYALPDAAILGEKPWHQPACDLTHPCVLFVGQIGHHGHDGHDSFDPQVWSLPFYVNPTAGDTGANPGNGLPEVPYVLALPALAFGMFGGMVWIRRRRSAKTQVG
jgi:hypothetical protein